MSTIIDTKTLKNALNTVKRAAATKTTLPILENILLTTKDGKLQLSATDLEMTIKTELDVTTDLEGLDLTLPAKTLAELVASISEKDLEIKLAKGDNKVTIKSGGLKSTLSGMPSSEFPALPGSGKFQYFTMDALVFKTLVGTVINSASEDDARPVLGTVSFELSKAGLRMVATDGFQMSMNFIPLDPAPEFEAKALVLASSLKNIFQTIKKAGPVEIGLGNEQASFKTPEALFIIQLVEGHFPDVDAIIPRSTATNITTNRAQLIAACKQAEIIARGNNSHPCKLTLTPDSSEKKGEILLASSDDETGSTEINIPATITGPGLTIAFNSIFLKESLEVISSETVSIGLNKFNMPALIVPFENKVEKHVLMPLHLG
jgi:DNA polymerase III subunit beta